MSFVHVENRVASRNHRCAACGIVIPKRCEYVRTFDVYDDGSGFTTRWHTECRAAFERMLTAAPDLTWEEVPKWLEDKYVGIAFENEVLSEQN